MTAAYLLIPETDGERKIALDQGHAWKIGRNDDNEVVIFNDLVSRHHAILQQTSAGEYYLMDMGSRNGSFVNGARVSFPRSLKDGDAISLGDYQLSFHWPEEPAAAVSVPRVPVGGEPTRALLTLRKSSVLVSDVRDYTKLTQKIEPSVMCNMIGTWFREGGQLMQEYGSWTQKYIGDALMSVWVHPHRDKESLEIWRILKAGVELVDITDTLQARFGLSFPIRIGMGINSGEATMGHFGSVGVSDHTALGDMVNSAFRFESATKSIGMDVIIGHGTYECLAEVSEPQRFFSQRVVELKGYDHPSEVWAATYTDLKQFVQEPLRVKNGA